MHVNLPRVSDTATNQHSIKELKRMIKSMKEENCIIKEYIKELKFELEAERRCSEAKDEKIDTLRKGTNTDKLDMIILTESQYSLAHCSELLTVTLNNKQKEIK